MTKLTNINFMSKTKFDSLVNTDDGELYYVEEFPAPDFTAGVAIAASTVTTTSEPGWLISSTNATTTLTISYPVSITRYFLGCMRLAENVTYKTSNACVFYPDK
ncbi:MAG: hypothetical protein IJ479_03370 [Alphaproteobacteria bacterium]|nr:hypothetical protein [Alphaproteobacteria bacterium]